MASDWTIETLSLDDFLAAEPAWNELVAASRHPGPFLTHPWVRLWWKHFGEGQEFALPVVRDGVRWVAAVPLALRRARWLGRTVTVAEIVGTGPVPTRGMGLADKADLVVRADAQDAWPLLSREITRYLERVDVLDLKGFDAGSPLTEALAGTAAAGGSMRTLPRSVSPYLPLTSSWEDYLKSRSRNFRKHMKKHWRMLEQEGETEIERLEPDLDPGPWMRDVIAVNGESWKATRGTNLFRHPRIREFFVELVPAMIRHGWLDLNVLRVNRKAVAYELCFDLGGRVFSYNGAYRRELARASPGTVLTAVVIENAYARGRTEYDMLRGEEEYKTRWSDERRQESQILVPASGAFSRLYGYAGVYLKARLKASPRINEAADKLSGLLTRLRH